MGARKPPQPFQFVTDTSAPAAVQAASLGLAIIAAVKCETWDDLVLGQENDDPAVQAAVSTFELTVEQHEILTENEPWLTLLRQPLHKSGGVGVSLAVCPVCGLVSAAASAAATSCALTDQCPGVPIKAKRAVRRKTDKGAKSAAVSVPGDTAVDEDPVEPDDQAEADAGGGTPPHS
ncbi:MAG: hypothetical protein ACR2P2_08405 [Nakamurella sp.]